MGHRARRILGAGRGLAGQRVRCCQPSNTASWQFIGVTPVWMLRPVGDLEPEAEATGLGARRLLPGYLHEPQETEPTKEVNRVGAHRRRRPPKGVNVPQIIGDPGDGLALQVEQPTWFEGVDGRG